MKLRHQFLLAFLAAGLAALVATDLTYRVVYSWQDGTLIRFMSSSPEATRTTTILLVVVVPFCWMLIFLLVAARVLGRRLGRPLRELAQAAEQMKRKDLDFAITYSAPDELGDVCRAFAEMQRELKAALDREWREQEAQREMMAAIAHDLRTPLTMVQGHAEALLQAPPHRRTERLERYLAAILSGAQRASGLLNELLDLSRFQRADFRLNLRPVALQNEMARWVPEYELAAHEKGVRLRWDPDSTGDGLIAPADLARVHQVVDNLLTNALRHSPPGSQITLSVRWRETEVCVEVRDTGPGFAAADLPHLFDCHFQGRDGAVGAAGIGLYVSRLLVERHGGRIWAANHPDGGGLVAFSLPRALPDQEQHVPPGA